VNSAEIIEYLNRSPKHRKKFQYIARLILEGIRNTETYDRENINDRCKDVTAMKFFKGNSNDRIYCKEVRSRRGVFVVVAAVLHEKKKSQKNSAREISQIEKVSAYDYSPKPPADHPQ